MKVRPLVFVRDRVYTTDRSSILSNHPPIMQSHLLATNLPTSKSVCLDFLRQYKVWLLAAEEKQNLPLTNTILTIINHLRYSYCILFECVDPDSQRYVRNYRTTYPEVADDYARLLVSEAESGCDATTTVSNQSGSTILSEVEVEDPTSPTNDKEFDADVSSSPIKKKRRQNKKASTRSPFDVETFNNKSRDYAVRVNTGVGRKSFPIPGKLMKQRFKRVSDTLSVLADGTIALKCDVDTQAAGNLFSAIDGGYFYSCNDVILRDNPQDYSLDPELQQDTMKFLRMIEDSGVLEIDSRV